MAGKVNTKFVSFLAVAIVLGVVGAGAFYALFVRKSNADLLAAGDKHLQLAQTAEQASLATRDDDDAFAAARAESGMNYRLAAESYGMAYQRDRSNSEVLLKYISARRKMTVKDGAEAAKILREVAKFTREATELRREDSALLEGYYQQLYDWGRTLNTPSFFTELLTLTTAKLQSEPDNLAAIKFNQIARSLNLSEAADRQAQDNVRGGLEKVLEARPDDTDAMHFLARWHLFDAKRLQRSQSEPSVVNAATTRALELSAKAFAAAPNDGDVAIEHLSVLLDPSVNATEDARPVLEGLVSYLSTNPDPPALVARVSRLLSQIEREAVELPDSSAVVTTGTLRAETMLRKAVELKPGVLMFRVLLAENLKTQLRMDDAYSVFIAARDHEISGPFEDALLDESLRQQAMYEVANIEVIRAEAAANAAERKQLLMRVDQAISSLEAVTGESGRVLMLRGKTHLLRGANAQAMIAIDKASDLYNDRNLEALLLSARARQTQKQWGATAQRLRQALGLVGQSNTATATNVRLQLAETLIRTREFDEADLELQRILEAPNTRLTAKKQTQLNTHKQLAIILQARSLAGRGQTQQAIDLLENLGTQARSLGASRDLAGLYRQMGNKDRADTLLQELSVAHPTDLALLQQRVAAATDPQRIALLDQALAAGADPQAVDRLRAVVRNASTPDLIDRIDQAAGDDTSPLDLALAKATAHARNGNQDEARRYFEQAQTLSPENDRVVIMALDFAIADRDFDRAGTLVADAARRNLDLADGHLLRGKLAAAEGDLRQALASFELGLKERPVFDEGWRQYGDLRLQNDEAEAAANAYRRALDQRPDNLPAILGLARAQDHQGRQSAALEALASAVAYAPNNTRVVEQYMAYEAQHGRRERVVAARRRLAKSHPKNVTNQLNLVLLMARENQLEEALGTLDAVEASHGVTRETIGARAGALGIAGRNTEGADVIRSWVNGLEDGAQPADRLLLARYLVSVDKLDDAAAAYRSVAETLPNPEEAQRELADILFNNGRPADAAELYAEILTNAAQDSRQQVGLRLAEAQLRAGDNDLAIQTLDTLENDATSDALRAAAALNAGKPADALKMVDRAIEKDGDNSATRLQRAQIRLQVPDQDIELALADLDHVLAGQPNQVQALALRSQILNQLQRPKEAADTLQTLADHQPGNPGVREMLARTLIATGDRDRAAYVVREGLRIAPDRPGLLQLDAQLSRSSGNPAAAEASLLKLIETQPDNAAAVTQLAENYLLAGRDDDADILLNDRPAMLNRFPEMQALRGRALAASGQPEASRRVFALALERADSSDTASRIVRHIAAAFGVDATASLVEEVGGQANPLWTGLGLAGLDVGVKNYESALNRLDQLVPLAAAEPRLAEQVQRLKAISLLQSGRHAEAKDAYEALLARKPDDIEALNNLSFILLTALKNAEDALPFAERAAQLAGRNHNVLDTYGVALHRLGRLEDARVQLEASVEIAERPSNLLHLGELYADLTFYGRARTRLEEARNAATAAGDEDTARRAQRALDRLPLG